MCIRDRIYLFYKLISDKYATLYKQEITSILAAITKNTLGDDYFELKGKLVSGKFKDYQVIKLQEHIKDH